MARNLKREFKEGERGQQEGEREKEETEKKKRKRGRCVNWYKHRAEGKEKKERGNGRRKGKKTND